jgi:hypothetical protein
MKMHVAAGPVLLFAAAGAAAADMLPLARGIYVVVETPCKGASNAETLAYWGGHNGINDQQTGCEIASLSKAGSDYSLKRTCTSRRFGGSFEDKVKVTISDRTTFVIERRTPLGNQVRKFRYCGPEVQF